MQRLASLLSVMVMGLVGFALSASSEAGDKKKEVGGQPKVERGPEIKVLESLVGVFDAKIKFFVDPKAPPKESVGVMTRTMILGGNILQESFKGEFIGMEFSGIGMVGYDPQKNKFITTWCDSMSSSIMVLEGLYDAKAKTFTNVGTDYEPNTKKKMKARDVLTLTGADTQKFEMYRLPEGAPEEFKVMEIMYTRKKAGK